MNNSTTSTMRYNETYMDQKLPKLQQSSIGDDGSAATSSYHDLGHNLSNEGGKGASQQEPQRSMPIEQEQPMVLPYLQQCVSFHSSDYKEHRQKIYIRFGLIILAMATLLLTALSIYWGSFYEISEKTKDLKMLVVIGDESTIEGVSPVFGTAMEALLKQPPANSSGDWHIYKEGEFKHLAQDHDNTIREEILRQIHHQLYWAAIYVKPNASYNYHQALANGDTRYNVSDDTVAAYYETARDFIIIPQYVTPLLKKIETLWLHQQSNMISQLAQNVTINSTPQTSLLAQSLQFTMVDKLPISDHVLGAPMQLGFIYLIIVSFFQVSFFAEPHQKVAKTPIKRPHYLLYRYISSILAFFFLSLIFGLASLAYQIDFTVTYGKSGFLVYWSITFLTMCAVGLANEVMAMLIIPIYPPLLGFWLIFWVIVNIAPTYNAVALTNNFYRYGYAIPIHNGYEATKTVFFDVYKGQLGRNIGILIAWIFVLTVVFPFVLKRFAKLMMKKAATPAEAEKGK